MAGTEIVTAIIEILMSGITGVATGMGNGIKALVDSLFFVKTGDATTGLSAFFTMVVVFAGISLALGLCRWVVNFLTSLGKSDR